MKRLIEKFESFSAVKGSRQNSKAGLAMMNDPPTTQRCVGKTCRRETVRTTTKKAKPVRSVRTNHGMTEERGCGDGWRTLPTKISAAVGGVEPVKVNGGTVAYDGKTLDERLDNGHDSSVTDHRLLLNDSMLVICCFCAGHSQGFCCNITDTSVTPNKTAGKESQRFVNRLIERFEKA